MPSQLYIILAAAILSFPSALYSAPNIQIPKWGTHSPQANVILKAGDKVFVLSHLRDDPFTSVHTIAKDGTILPKFCEKRIVIAGFSETDASTRLLEHTDKQNVYDKNSGVKLAVIRINRPQQN